MLALIALLGSYASWCLGLPGTVAATMVVCYFAVTVATYASAASADRYVAAAFLLALLVIALGSPSDSWDARSIWLFHGKRIFVDGTASSQLDGYASWSQNDYPVLVPALMASLASLVGTWNELFPKSAVVLALAPVLPLLLFHLGSAASRLAFCCFILLASRTMLVNGYMDALLGIYFVVAFVTASQLFLGRPSAGEREHVIGVRKAVLATAALAVLTLIKNEGIVALVAILGALAAVSILVHHRLPMGYAILSCAIALIPVALWKLDVSAHGVVNDLAAGSGERIVTRFPNLFFHVAILKSMLLRPEVLLPLAVIVLRGKVIGRSPYLLAGLLAAAGYGFVIYLVYLSTPHDIRWHLTSSADRTILPTALLLGFIALCSLKSGQSVRNHLDKADVEP